jgi:hypothetical protein
VDSPQGDLGDFKAFDISAWIAVDECIVVKESPFLQGRCQAEIPFLRADFRVMLVDDVIIGVEDGEVRIPLVQEEAKFRRDIVIKIGVSVQMVLGDVEHEGNMGPKRFDSFQLKTADLGHHVIACTPSCTIDQRVTDISSDEDVFIRLMEHISEQQRSGGLPVCPRYSDDGVPDESTGQFDLAYYLDAIGASRLEGLDVQGNSRADHDEVSVQKGSNPVLPEFGFYSQVPQH